MLVELQVLDKTLYKLEQDHQNIPVKLKQLDDKEAQLRAALQEAQEELEQVAARRKELEKDVEAVKARQRRAENRLMGAKTQREYRAANAEIDEAKDSIKGKEEVLLELMERQESLEIEVTKHGEVLEEFLAASEAERKEMTARVKRVARELKRLGKQRGGLLKGVDAGLLSKYDFIRQRRQGVALAPVKAGTCLMCHMDIPPQQFNELQRMDRVMACPSCQRLLYWADADGFETPE